jgi:hypothetical protein
MRWKVTGDDRVSDRRAGLACDTLIRTARLKRRSQAWLADRRPMNDHKITNLTAAMERRKLAA